MFFTVSLLIKDKSFGSISYLVGNFSQSWVVLIRGHQSISSPSAIKFSILFQARIFSSFINVFAEVKYVIIHFG